MQRGPPDFHDVTYALYDIATTILGLGGIAWLCVRRRHRALLGRLAPRIPLLPDRPIWLQACSVGEVGVARSMIPVLRRRWPGTPILLTVSTLAGRALAARTCSGVAQTWCPFDHRLAVARFVRQAKPRALVLIETEIWPNMLRETAKRGIPSIIVNGRLSDRHFPRYARVRALLRPVLRRLTAAGMQNREYAERMMHLGALPDSIHVTGNTKFDAVATDVSEAECRRIRDENAFKSGDLVVVFGSTRPGDEALAAACWRELSQEFPSLRLVVAPRHLERVDAALACFEGEPVLRRSAIRQGEEAGSGRVLLLDTTGELVSFYAASDIAVVCGSFYPGVEGHNPLEPAALGVTTVFGRYMRNFVDPARVLVDVGGAHQVASPDDLPGLLRDLLSDPARRRETGLRGREAALANRGAIERTVDLIEDVLGAETGRGSV